MIDINYLEESSGVPNFILALLPNYDKIVLLECSSRMHVDNLEKMINLAMIGCKDVYAILNKYIKENISSLSKNFNSNI